MPLDLRNYELPLSGFDLVSIVLFGAFQERPETRERGWSVYFKEDIDEQLMILLNREKHNTPLIRENFYFDNQGAFPYSKEVSAALFELAEYRALTRIMGESGRIARPLIGAFAKDSLNKGRISSEDYQKLSDLGRQLEIKRIVHI